MNEDTSDDEYIEPQRQHDQDSSASEQQTRSSLSDRDSYSQRESSDPPDPYRSNRYNGPPQRWLGWTAEERDISRSLDLLRARNLSLHLYNFHNLKAKTEGIGAKSGRSWLSNDWAAWPMTAQDVPRSDIAIRRGFPAQNDRGFSLDESRTDLKDILLACITKTARQRFMARDYDDQNPYHSAASESIAFVESDNVLTSSSITESGTGSSSSQETTRQETVHARSLKIKRSISDISLASLHSIVSDEDFEPTAILDDETAMQIAKPSIEHIISSLEQLLQALHNTRQNYSIISRSTTHTKSTKKPSKSDKTPILSDSDAHPSQSSKRSKQNSSKNYGLRSWKDILGTAAILGWDSAALRRARDRCSVLFGESMAMPVLDFDTSPNAEAEGSKRARPSVPDSEEVFGGVHVDGYLRPIKRRRKWTEEDVLVGHNERLENSNDVLIGESDPEESQEVERSTRDEARTRTRTKKRVTRIVKENGKSRGVTKY